MVSRVLATYSRRGMISLLVESVGQNASFLEWCRVITKFLRPVRVALESAYREYVLVSSSLRGKGSPLVRVPSVIFRECDLKKSH